MFGLVRRYLEYFTALLRQPAFSRAMVGTCGGEYVSAGSVTVVVAPHTLWLSSIIPVIGPVSINVRVTVIYALVSVSSAR